MTEIKKLQKLFGKKTFVHAPQIEDNDKYAWYRTSEGEEIGVDLSTLSSDSQKLLEVFLNPLSDKPNQENKSQQIWYELLYQNHTPDHSIDIEEGRLLHFSIHSQDVEHDLFVEAFQNMFSDAIIPVWKDRYTGVFVELTNQSSLSMEQLNELLHTIESDFYMKTSLFIGSVFSSLTEAKNQFDIESSFFKIAKDHPEGTQIHTLSSVLPSILIYQSKREDIQYINNKILKPLETDLIKTVKVLLDCSLNYTLAAKKLFIHRNSLQYRIEKFTDLTGLDPKEFKDAVTIYLLLSMPE